MDVSRSWLLEESFATICICVLAYLSFSYAHYFCLDVRYVSVYVFAYTNSCAVYVCWWACLVVALAFVYCS